MSLNKLNDIVKCSVSVSNPASGDASYDSILIIVPPDENAKLEGVGVVKDILEVAALGFAETSVAYKASMVAFSQNPKPEKLYITVRELTEGGEDEGIDVTLARANEEVDFYGIHITSYGETPADVLAAAEWAETNGKLFGYEYTNPESVPVGDKYFKTVAICSADSVDEDVSDGNKYAMLALMAKCFGYDPGSETWAFKTLAGVNPSKLTAEQKKALEDKNITYYATYGGKNITSAKGGKVLAGEWIDVIRFRDWLVNKIQSNVFNVLTGNLKLPYTDGGITCIEGAIESALLEGQTKGGIAPTEYDEDGNAIPGFTVSVPTASSISDTDKQSRILKDCKFSARLAGAIHLVNISGNLTY